VPPAIPSLPAATDTAPPAGVIADPVEPGASCGNWARQDLYADSWAAATTWWEFQCTYAWPQVSGGATNADWAPSYWTDYFYWDGSGPVFYGEWYGDWGYGPWGSGTGCTYWWDQPSASWYVFDTAECPFTGPGNAAPTAAFDVSCNGSNCSFNASYSYSNDGIADARWDFGDGSTGTGLTTSHNYAVKGSYRVKLLVSDSGGLAGAAAHTVAITDISPTASFTVSCSGLTCSFDGSASSDPDGTIRGYYWYFGDGYSAMGSSSAQNVYFQAGSYQVTLEVVDNDGVAATSVQTVTVVGTSNDVPPVARFTYSCLGLTCHFDGSGSSDSDGTIATYQWDFGDSDVSLTSASAVDHTYSQAGSYSVALRVVDSGKASANSGPTMVTVPGTGPCCVSVGSASILEGDVGTHMLRFLVTLSQPSTVPVSVDYAVTGGSATVGAKPGPGVDVIAKSSGTVQFNVGTNGVTPVSRPIGVRVVGDPTIEPDETFTVHLTSAAGTTIGARGTATGTVIDDDSVPGLSVGVGDGAIVEGNLRARAITLPVTLSETPAADVSVSYTVTPGTASYASKATTPGGDYGGANHGTLTFVAGGQTTRTVSIPVWPDTAGEPNETFTLTITNVSTGVSIVRPTGTGTIIDDD